ncbi:MAG TPA: CRISPR-associated endonuclease Cas2 [Bacteroidetes bacterium]|nr:CRISPR-associated endonuclease Cas2 [Bacteroidota bacterium]
MMVLVTYDVETVTARGRKRLRRVAKECTNFGQRVQNSVFECVIDPAQMAELKHRLENIIDIKKDSLRFYYLGNQWKRRVEHLGTKPTYNPESDTLLV